MIYKVDFGKVENLNLLSDFEFSFIHNFLKKYSFNDNHFLDNTTSFGRKKGEFIENNLNNFLNQNSFFESGYFLVPLFNETHQG